MSEERWLPIPGYEGLYEVSDLGRVRSLDRVVQRIGGKASGRPVHLRGAIRLSHIDPTTGYWKLSLCREGRQRTHSVHGLVMLTFVGPPPAGMEIRHLDGDRENARLANLSYGQPSDNALDRVRHGTHNMASKTHCKRGHEFTPENTHVRKSDGGRECRSCIRHRKEAKRAA